MPTKRLTDSDRETIRGNFSRAADRALNNKPFPIAEDAWKAWSRSLLPDEILAKWEYLTKHCPKLVSSGSSWHANFFVEYQGFKYTLAGYSIEMPHDDIVIPESHPSRVSIGEWSEWYFNTAKDVREAIKYLEMCIEPCHSIGQVKRVLGDEILRFVPNWFTNSLEYAERQSRVPSSLSLDPERLEHLSNVLALASLSPEEKPGVDISVASRIESEIKEV